MLFNGEWQKVGRGVEKEEEEEEEGVGEGTTI